MAQLFASKLELECDSPFVLTYNGVAIECRDGAIEILVPQDRFDVMTRAGRDSAPLAQGGAYTRVSIAPFFAPGTGHIDAQRVERATKPTQVIPEPPPIARETTRDVGRSTGYEGTMPSANYRP